MVKLVWMRAWDNEFSTVMNILRMYSKPARVMASLRALGNSSGTFVDVTDTAAITNRGCCFLPQREAAFFAAFPVDQNAGLRLKHHILDPESHQFRDPQATREAEMKHCTVTDALAESRVGGIQNRLHLLAVRCLTSRVCPFFAGMARMRSGSAPVPTARDIPYSA